MIRLALLLAACTAALVCPAWSQTPPATSASLSNSLEVSNGSATIRVTALTDSILRLRVARGGNFAEDASWAVPADVRAKSAKVQTDENGLRTAALAVRIDPSTLALTVTDLKGRTIHADAATPLNFDGSRFTLRKAMPVGEQYFGLGDKTGPFNRRGASYVHWNTDAWGFDRGTDPIYKGRDLLIAPSPKPESTHGYDVCMPGPGWFDYWTGMEVEGETKPDSPFEVVKELPALDRLPVFVRAGAIIPRQAVTQSTSEVPEGPLVLHVYPGPDCRGEIYWDDGVSVRGSSLRQTVRCTLGKDGLMLHFDKREGRFKPWWKQIAVTVHGWSGPAKVRGASHADTNPARKDLWFVIPDQRRASDFVISRF